jgi:putative acetyltransferase
MIRVSIESPYHAHKLIDELDKHLLERTPKEYAHLMTPEELVSAGADMFIVRDNGQPIACCAMIRHENVIPDAVVELKRMFVSPRYRSHYLADKIIRVIEAVCVIENYYALLVETGDEKNYAPAHRHLKRIGFQRCGPFLDYKESEHSAFFFKIIS